MKYIKETKKERGIITIIAGGMILLLLLIVLVVLCRWMKIKKDIADDHRRYAYHIAMIGENSADVFWQSVYNGAASRGNECDIFVESFGSGLEDNYSAKELLKMAIASRVDGIIMEAEDDEETAALLKQASDAGIPVITMLKDVPKSERISFVSANDYALGEIYGSQVLETAKKHLKNKEEESIKVSMLIDMDQNSTAPNLIYSGISEAILQDEQNIELNTIVVDNEGEFETEETVRDLLLDEAQRPDILVCSSVIDTTSAYQCIIDYNLVGEVQIIGYYASEEIMDGIQKEIICSTVVINAEEMGSLAVDGMHEYLTNEYVNDYITVSTHLITKDNVSAYYEEFIHE